MGKRKTPFGLTTEQLIKRSELIGRLQACEPAIRAAIEQLDAALMPYNAVLTEVVALGEAVSRSAEVAYNERSDAWVDSDAGGAADEFWNAWDAVANSHQRTTDLMGRRLRTWRLPVESPEIPRYSDVLANLPEAPRRTSQRRRR